MPHSFSAFIDESGDDGLDPDKFRKIGDNGGSSNWMSICACIIRTKNEAETVSWRDRLKTGAGKKSKGRQLHFHQLNHQQRRYVARELATFPLRYTAALTNKKDIPEGTYTEKNQLYFYMTRYVIERISWFCRDHREIVPEGNGKVKIVFSCRGGISYEAFKDYLIHLKNNEVTEIYWPVIDIDQIDAQDHSRNAALQLADCGAKAITEAFEPNRFGDVEGSYLKSLKRVIYNRNSNYHSYGLKIIPNWNEATLSNQHIEILNEFKVMASGPSGHRDAFALQSFDSSG
ncbi:DUF3800 domain-containing protein [Roseibium sp. RKSG952]|uniref:DUF3800 domain-containing protein n=1 Tax=Roseibium sp. RKSG952 TaxID=2529384 RepID=UPI0012BBCEB2|nr:DUF3800 domain-containing protein [Roseibium sp. RKSG952]MTH96553.1 DUF3800 domain-containing protein [Roseibium sp. RKSG952]